MGKGPFDAETHRFAPSEDARRLRPQATHNEAHICGLEVRLPAPQATPDERRRPQPSSFLATISFARPSAPARCPHARHPAPHVRASRRYHKRPADYLGGVVRDRAIAFVLLVPRGWMEAGAAGRCPGLTPTPPDRALARVGCRFTSPRRWTLVCASHIYELPISILRLSF